MTVLGKIRQRSGLLVTVIAIALLIFILEQALESKNSFFSGDQKRVGEVNGKNISIDDYQAQLDQAIESQKERDKKTTVDDNTMESLRGQVWNQLVYQYTMEPEYKELGVTVSVDELDDMVRGKNPHASVKQAFTDPKSGQFDPASVTNFLKNMDKDETGATKLRWLNFEDAVKKERIAAKFNNLIKGGLYVTKSQAKQAYIDNEQKVKFSYVLQRYSNVQDSAVKVSDEEIQKQYNENKNKYKQAETMRSISYLTFDVTASPSDVQATQEQMNRVAADFKTAAVDSDFVNANSDNKYVASFYNKGMMDPFTDSLLLNAASGFVYGPVSMGNSIKIYKVTGIKMVPDSVKARHILVKINNGNTAAAKAKADSLKGLLKTKKFDELAKTNSEDPGSAIKGGDLGWFRDGMMVKPFNDACFNGKVGDIVVVESQFGIHLIEVTGRGIEKRKVEIATIDRSVEPSSQTFQAIYGKASEFAGKNTSAQLFDSAIVKQGLNKRIADNIRETDRNLAGLENARELVRWAYSAKKGDISKVFELSNKYVIAQLTEIKDKGILPLDAVKAQVETEAKKEKKAQQFSSSFKAAMAGVTSLDQLAPKVKSTAEKVENQTFANSSVMGVGREGAVVGNVFAMKVNKISEPIKGDAGVFVVQVTEITPPAATKDYKANQTQVQGALKQRVDYELFEALKDKADVQDNRAKFY
ncbi:MAG: SurA N-terminal domain-containing protein [Bacteroidetes bacterium]|nr:SurA N-terminal domain-containing protein [Bacteroidota bacterium]